MLYFLIHSGHRNSETLRLEDKTWLDQQQKPIKTKVIETRFVAYGPLNVKKPTEERALLYETSFIRDSRRSSFTYKVIGRIFSIRFCTLENLLARWRNFFHYDSRNLSFPAEMLVRNDPKQTTFIFILFRITDPTNVQIWPAKYCEIKLRSQIQEHDRGTQIKSFKVSVWIKNFWCYITQISVHFSEKIRHQKPNGNKSVITMSNSMIILSMEVRLCTL